MKNRHLHLVGALSGNLRTAQFRNREHLVIPVVGLVEGVVHAVNAPKPELVLATELAKSVSTWNGRPVISTHPVLMGEHVSANLPEILEAQTFGLIFGANVDKKRLLLESWIDVARTLELGGDPQAVVDRAKAQKDIEISVGAMMTLEEVMGVFEGKSYAGIWRNIMSDHLAMLPEGQRGACSVAMGCGAPRAMSRIHVIKPEGLEIEDPDVADDKKSLKDKVLTLLGLEDAVPAPKEPEVRAASDHDCSCKGARNMEKKARIKALMESPYLPFKGLPAESTEKFIDGLPEDELKKLETQHETAKKAADDQAAAERTAAEKKAAEERAAAEKKAQEDAAAAARAAQAGKTPEQIEKEFLDNPATPQSIRDMVARMRTAEATRRTELVGKLKALTEGVHTEDQLKAMPLEQLESLAKLLKAEVPAVDFSGAGMRRENSGNKDDDKVPAPIDFVAHMRAAQAKK